MCFLGLGCLWGVVFLIFWGWSGLGFVFVDLRLCCGVCVCWICGFLGVLWVVCLVSLVFLELFTFGVDFALGLMGLWCYLACACVSCGRLWVCC